MPNLMCGIKDRGQGLLLANPWPWCADDAIGARWMCDVSHRRNIRIREKKVAFPISDGIYGAPMSKTGKASRFPMPLYASSDQRLALELTMEIEDGSLSCQR